MNPLNLFIKTAHAAPALQTVGTMSLRQIFFVVAMNLVLPLLSILSVGAIIWSGIMFVTSQGDPEKLKTAKAALLWAILGIMLIASSALIVIYLNKFANG